MMEAQTLVACLAEHAQKTPEDVALREKNLGLWQETTWQGYWDEVVRTARALEACGVKAGDGVGILSDNRPQWLYADLGAQLLGARTVGIYQTNPPEDVAYVLNDAKCSVLFCEDQEQVDKAVEIKKQTPSLQKVVVFDSRGTRDIDDSRLLSWAEFLKEGETIKTVKEWLSEKLKQRSPEEATMVIYTSGTTGHPKGALLSSGNALTSAAGILQVLNVSKKDSVLSYLPLCHVAEKIFSLFLPMRTGLVVHFGESIGTVQADLREVSPSIFLGVPRIWEKMQAGVVVKMQNSSWLKRTLFQWALRQGAEKQEVLSISKNENHKIGLVGRAKLLVARVLIFRPLLGRLGMGRCRIAVSGAAPIGQSLLSWYHSIELSILEGYGMTENAGVSHMNPPRDMKIGTVGKVVPGVKCKIASDGEILLRGGNIFGGYLGKPEASAEAIDSEAWLHTGDIGQIDPDGYLSITGRKKGIIITSGGKNLSPEKIENALKTSPYIKEVIAIGEQRKFVSALVQIEFDVLSDWATRQAIPYTSFSDLCSREAVRDFIEAEIDKANQKLARVEQVRKFRLLDKELSQDDGELTATQKVRRKVVIDRFDSLISDMYGAAKT